MHGDSGLSETELRRFQMNLKYLGQTRLELRGKMTGQIYLFSVETPVQPVDLRDARFILASPLFTVA